VDGYHTATDDDTDVTDDEGLKKKQENGKRPEMYRLKTDDMTARRISSELQQDLDDKMAKLYDRAQDLTLRE
jgi:hypothetical protein